jgi:PTH2 family peptidyl-tRNA hydrolase
MPFKQAIIVDEDLDLSKGKMAAQVAHASLGAYRKASTDTQEKWKRQGEKKVILAAGENSLKDLVRQAERNKIPAHIVKDAGRTEVKPGTVTALGLGPEEGSKIDTITGSLKLID